MLPKRHNTKYHDVGIPVKHMRSIPFHKEFSILLHICWCSLIFLNLVWLFSTNRDWPTILLHLYDNSIALYVRGSAHHQRIRANHAAHMVDRDSDINKVTSVHENKALFAIRTTQKADAIHTSNAVSREQGITITLVTLSVPLRAANTSTNDHTVEIVRICRLRNIVSMCTHDTDCSWLHVLYSACTQSHSVL